MAKLLRKLWRKRRRHLNDDWKFEAGVNDPYSGGDGDDGGGD